MEDKKRTISLFLVFFAVALSVSLAFSALFSLLPKKPDQTPSTGLEVAVASMQGNAFEVMGEGGVGTGFIVTEAEGGGVIALSCYHVTKADSAFLAVRMAGDDSFRYGKATIIGYDKDYDVSVMKIEGDYDFVDLVKQGKMDGTFSAGESVALLGNSAGEGIKAFDGIIGAPSVVVKCDDANSSNLHLRYLPAVHVTSAVNAGSSGSPVFNQNGEIVGMGFYQAYSNGDRPLYDVSFALPVEIVNAVLNRALYGDDAYHGLTARIEKIDQQESELILKSTVTAEFRDINFTVTADLTLNTLKVKGGANDGKTVVAVGGVEVKTLSQLCAVMLGYTAGGKGEALLVTFKDGTSVELDARNNLI